MDRKHLDTLEYPKVLELLARHTYLSAGRELALRLEPYAHLDDAQRAQQATEEARRLRDLKPGLDLSGASDIRPQVQRAQLGGVLLPGDLLQVAATVRVARTWKAVISRLGSTLPVLATTASRLGEHPGLAETIEESISETGEVADRASPALKRIRSQLRDIQERLLARLHEIITSPAYRQALQDPIITQRSGRYVVPVKAEFKGQVKGVVHDQSASGATLFVEPMAIMDLANQRRQAEIEEDREIQRVLRQISQEVAQQAPSLTATVEALAELDLAMAKARLAEEMRAIRPGLLASSGRPRPQPVIHLIDARHPLLHGTVVPISVELGRDFDALVITGPNTGGKTVALKTIGLLAAMAQAGLQIPAGEGSSISVFRDLFADIGDEQSIEQSLSTFSAHITRIIDILVRADEHCLVLLDELGAGTDPQEGSALARAILSYLVRRGIPTVATTHCSELKSYAHATARVENASVQFDLETLSPTYRLQIGLPGQSNALAIAERLGMPAEVLDEARSLLTPQEAQIEELLYRIQQEKEAAAAARRLAETEATEAEKLRRRYQESLDQLETSRAAILREVRGRAEADLAELRREIQRLLQRAAAAGTDRSTLEQLAREARSKSLPQRPAAKRTGPDETSGPATLRPGSRVTVLGLGVRGTVVGIDPDGDDVEVQVQGKRMRVHRSRLSDAEPAGPETTSPAITSLIPKLMPSYRQREVGLQLDLRGQRREDAVLELDRYLNDAYLAGLGQVRVVHGKGSGTVRQAVRETLDRHPLVEEYEPAPPQDGGDGVTLVRLAQ